MILACPGGSNVGQLSNQAAVELTQEGFGKMFCLAGVGGHLGGFVQSAKDVPQMVADEGANEKINVNIAKVEQSSMGLIISGSRSKTLAVTTKTVAPMRMVTISCGRLMTLRSACFLPNG
jgi:hypothetical protein